MIKNEAVDKLHKRYPDIHPLLFHRSVEKAKNLVELFDILEGLPKKMPIVWDNEQRQWINGPIFRLEE